MITETQLERRKKQNYVALRVAEPIPFGKYLQPAWDELYDRLESKGIKPAGPAIIRYLTPDMSKELDIDVGFSVAKAVKGSDRITVDASLKVNMQRSCTPDPTKGEASSKQRLHCWNGRRKTRSYGIPRRKRALKGGTDPRGPIFQIRPLKKTPKSFKRSFRF